ncbi:hypothetical protein H5410_030569, partial [Solanum commersonii]
MLGLLERMAQAGTLPVPSDASQTHVGCQTPDLMVAPNSQTPRIQPTVVVALYLDSMELPGQEDQSGDYGGALRKSQGYLGRGYHSQSTKPIHAVVPAFETGFAGHSSSRSVHTSHGSSSSH